MQMYILQEDLEMSDKYMKRASLSLITQEMQIKTIWESTIYL